MSVAFRTAARNEDPPPYGPEHSTSLAEDQVIARALHIIESRLQVAKAVFTDPKSVREYLTLLLASREYESFVVLFLTTQHGLLAVEEMFRGTLAQTSVYPREVARAALRHNAGAIICAHNHPSGSAVASRADEALTTALKASLALVDVRVLDHIVVGGMETFSFAEHGLL